jgi:hypothetical protein
VDASFLPTLDEAEAAALVSVPPRARIRREVRPPAVEASRRNLAAAYRLVPALHRIHRALPDVVVEAASVNIADHLHGDYWHEHRLIRVECHHPPRVIAFTILHEFGHALDRSRLDDAVRALLLEVAGLPTWAGADAPWEVRGEEWFADGFAWSWWPSHFRPPPIPWDHPAPPPGDDLLRHFALPTRRPAWRRWLPA